MKGLSPVKVSIACAGLLLLAGTNVAYGRARCIAHGWDLLNVSPAEVLAHADSFARTGVDGVLLMVREKGPDGREISFSHGLPDRVWPADARERLQPVVATCRQIAARRGLSESLVNVWMFPEKRLDWTDDAVWANFATNLATAAWLARAGGLRGLALDNEDYRKARQFFWQEGDPPYPQALELARRRGREVFGAMFREYPEITLVAFWLYAQENEWDRPAPNDLRRFAQDNRRLWPAFLDGLWDAMPPTARAVDGNEHAYNYIAARGEYYRSACDQRYRLSRAAAPEHRGKVAAQYGCGFGMYLDNYVKGRACRWYAGLTDDPVHDFRANLVQATAATEDYVWIYGEKSVWAPWRNLRMKRWETLPLWDVSLPGLYSAIRSVTDPFALAQEGVAGGSLTNGVADLVRGTAYWHDDRRPRGRTEILPKALKADGPNGGAFLVSVPDVRSGETYVLAATAAGRARHALVSWKRKGAWDWKALPVSFLEFAPRPGAVRQCGAAAVEVPEGADELVLQLSGDVDAGERVEYADVVIARILDQQGGRVK